MTITFVGHGYVGLVTATVFADLGNKVHVIGHSQEKIDNLKKGILPIYEPGLEEMVKRNVSAGRLLFSLDYDGVKESEVVFIAVGTPPMPTGEADLSVVFDVAEKVGKSLADYTVVIVKSTVPIGTNFRVKELIEKVKPEGVEFDIASVPEFLREGVAITDTLHPSRIVIGTETKKAQEKLTQLHKPIDGELVLTNIPTAEMIKYASNAFLAIKISFANAIAQLSEKTGAYGPDVLRGVGLDRRIGMSFLNAGAGWGGSCFPKDVKALDAIAKENGYNFSMIKSAQQINEEAMQLMVEKAVKMLGDVKDKTIGVLGLAFKPDTDDMRDAPAIYIINKLLEAGAKIQTFDPIALDNGKRIFKNKANIVFCEDEYSVAKGADLLMLVTEWNEFKEMDLAKVKELMHSANLIDGRNIYDIEKAKALGFNYLGVGR
ncbi:MAG TPA: UDP-glucose/GDP-mannose dehydrogenase family protein [Patescibacteria group bacterium]|nr:UDP-glucose/GDP-mannose dehydrogenase family protein [Patescibacteria group bacterium]